MTSSLFLPLANQIIRIWVTKWWLENVRERSKFYISMVFTEKIRLSRVTFCFYHWKNSRKKLGAVGLWPVLRNRVSRGAFRRLKTIRDFEEEKKYNIIIKNREKWKELLHKYQIVQQGTLMKERLITQNFVLSSYNTCCVIIRNHIRMLIRPV